MAQAAKVQVTAPSEETPLRLAPALLGVVAFYLLLGLAGLAVAYSRGQVQEMGIAWGLSAVGGVVALVISHLWQRIALASEPAQRGGAAFASVGMATMARLGIPLGGLLAVNLFTAIDVRGGLLAYLAVFYFLGLLVETLVAVRRVRPVGPAAPSGVSVRAIVD